MRIKYKDGQPCEHRGCLNHLSHPCEGCGRIGGVGIVCVLEDKEITVVPFDIDKEVKIIE